MTRQLELRQVSVNYASFTAARDISLNLETGQIGCLLGPSGCGKTTLLRAIAGFEPVAAGEISLHDHLISCPGFRLPSEQRRVGMVFQDFALFPHLNVRGNVGFGLNWLAADARRARIDKMLRLVGLSAQSDRYPHELSGGQQQRVALARALAPDPEILLLDEPFASLDTDLREQLACEVRDLLKANNVTAILVTHDQHEAFAMSDHIALLKDGELIQAGTPYQLYHDPASEFVAGFVGQGAILRLATGENPELDRALGLNEGEDPVPGERLKLLLRPEDVSYQPGSDLRLPVAARTFRGASYLYALSLPDGQRILCQAPNHVSLAIGDAMPVALVQRRRVTFRN